MKRKMAVTLGVGALVLLLNGLGLGGAFTVRGGQVKLEGRINCPAVPAGGGRVFAHLFVRGRDVAEPVRRPLNLAVVIDRSGSMGEQSKIENARRAVRTLVDRLRPDDVLSIVIYDDIVEVLRPAAKVGAGDIRGLIDEITPRGWTNLGGGLEEGIHQAERYRGRGYVNRVLLLSDGLANRGVTDPHSLSRMARDGRRESITVSAIGVGLEYNENLMVSLANGGGGNYYYLEHASDLASIFQKEFSVMSRVVAENCVLEFDESRGVELVDAIGLEVIREGSRVAIPLGDLSAGEAREVVVEFAVNAGSGRRLLAEGLVRYQIEGKTGGKSDRISLRIRQTRDLAEVERERDWDVQAKAEVAQSTRKVERAMEALDAGRRDEAMRALRDAEASLASAPAAAQGGAAGAMMKEQKSNLMNYQDALEKDKGNTSRAKKSIQYGNYQVQRKK